jgi:hypothetical protein
MSTSTSEHQRLTEYNQRISNWKNWGPYLSERAWGTVREDYSEHGTAWEYFPHDHARSRAYRWNEDGLAGISDRGQYLCFALALWNGRDSILKERLFGLSGSEGNHGEDVKEYYFYLDSTPTHSYMKMLYKYPQAAFPYADLVAENRRRGRTGFEYELLDTGVFEDDRYFDVFVEYAKAGENDILARITVANRGPEPAACHVLPTLWFRNTWSWGYAAGPMGDVPGKPVLRQAGGPPGALAVLASHPAAGDYMLYAEGADALQFTENETNTARLWGVPNRTVYVKDAFHRYLIQGETEAVNPAGEGTKTAALYRLEVPAGGSASIRLRLTSQQTHRPFSDFETIFARRQAEADEFYSVVHKSGLPAPARPGSRQRAGGAQAPWPAWRSQDGQVSEDQRRVQRQALAGMLWSKQFYYFDVEQWLEGDPAMAPPAARKAGRNRDWVHLNNFDVISMPDKWEYPWYAAWDLALHCIPLAMVDPDFAKRQLVLMTREWYMHPNGQLPAYEWAFGDVNPPVHAWAALRVYQIDAALNGGPDQSFLEGVFHKLLLNFTWWVNRKDHDGNNVFQGGFLGLDNISLFDRSDGLPAGGHIDQSDGTAWMGFFSLEMMRIALELAVANPVYQDLATKFFEHFLSIATAMTSAGHAGHALWDEEDGFFYDTLHLPGGRVLPLRVRSLVGLIPLLAAEVLLPDMLERMPDFARRTHWFLENRPHLSGNIASFHTPGQDRCYLASIVTPERLVRVLRYMLDEDEFLSPYGIRSLSKHHQANPVSLTVGGGSFSIGYEPAESQSGLFGGNSNWRGPVWFPINFLLIEALRRAYRYYGDTLKVECPTGSGQMMTLTEVAGELGQRLARLFLRNRQGERPVYGGLHKFQDDPHWRDYILFYEYFHGDNGAGLGASHQTGWTGLVAWLIQEAGGDA